MTSPDELRTGPPPGAGRPLDTGYLLDEVVGEGAAGKVWRGRRASDGLVVAIKVLHPQYSADEEILSRFVREHATLRQLAHPHLVRVLDLVSTGDTRAIVMEMIEGQNLRREAKTGAIDHDRTAGIMAQVAEALSYIHAAGIVHRDVKPENILVTWRGAQPWAQLTDFGIVLVTGADSLTRGGGIVGTMAYVAPELALNRPAVAATDVYALGITAYELLAGRRPFSADHPLALLRHHVETEPSRPDGISDAAWQIVAACLAKETSARPTAAQLARDFAALRGSLGPLPLSAPEPTPPRPAIVPEFAAPQPLSLPLSPPLPAGQPPSVGQPPSAGRPLSAGQPPSVGQGLMPQELETVGASRPVPEPPAPPRKTRRRWIWWLAAGLAVGVMAWGAGVWAGRDSTPPASPTPSSAAAKAQQWFLPVTATSPAEGTVRLDFADATTLPGFESYVIYLDGKLFDQVRPGKAPPYIVDGRHPQTKNCYRVAALVITDRPQPPDAPPACLTADGTGKGTP